MMCMTDLSNMEQVETLREVIRKCTDCSCVATLKQYVKRPDGSFNSVDLSNVPCDVNAEINVDNETVYIYIKTLERIQRWGAAPQPPASPLWKRWLDPLNKCSISERSAMGSHRLKRSGVGKDSIQKNNKKTAYREIFCKLFLYSEENN